MPEQNTPTPIKREDIKAGDRIRRIAVSDYVAKRDGWDAADDGFTYELINRPVVLPTDLGAVIAWDSPYVTHAAVLAQVDQWHYYGKVYTSAYIAARIADTVRSGHAFYIMRPVAEVAAEVIEAIREQGEAGISNLYEDLSVVAAKFGVTK